MRRTLLTILGAFTLTAPIYIPLCAPLYAQMHKVAKPEVVVRAVGVYEWTGDRAKPTASRFIPVSLFIDGEFQDADVYLARPVPMALDTGTVYEIDRAGIPQGTIDLLFARHLRGVDLGLTYDDGWFGYGPFVPPPAPKKTVAAKEKPPAPVNIASADSDRPSFVRRAPPNVTDSTKPDSSKPSSTPDSKPGASAGSAPTSTSPPSDDPDRPTLRKRSPEEAKKAKKAAEESRASGLGISLNDDPNRPNLHHGKGQQSFTEADLPKLHGVPPDLQQAVAVSDSKNREPHDFARPWEDDAERASILAKMQTLARAQLAGYKSPGSAAAPPPAAPKASSATGHAPASKLRHPRATITLPEPLFDESLQGYVLSYGGAATFVYSARTAGDGPTLRYVTIVAQIDAFNALQPAIQSVTDAAHLDSTPWMRLVDVVDADASNRASLLFELRGQSARQFALYRVIAARSEQIFLTGTTQ